MSRRSSRSASALISVALLLVAGCESSTGVSGEVADVRGPWEFTGTQLAPSLQLSGTLVIAGQDGDLVTGSLSWEERDGLGGTTAHAGSVSGRVIGLTDIDFDVFAGEGVRRHVARLGTGSMEGAWVQVSTGRSGEFAAAQEIP